MRAALLLLLPLLLIFSSNNCPPASALLHHHQSALLSIKASVLLDPLGLLSDWKPATHPCQWPGVGCDSIGRVVSLHVSARIPYHRTTHLRYPISSLPIPSSPRIPSNLTSLGLSGTLSPAIASLSHLRILSFPFNSFSGIIPPEISALRWLEFIDLEGNEFSGAIPAEVGRLAELKHLNLAHNSLDGEIPSAIAGCQKLEVLVLAGNRLSGEIPSSLGNMPRLRVISVSLNKLTGAIPSEIGHACRDLEVLDVSLNRLGGDIPPDLGNCSSLSVLVLTNDAPIPVTERKENGELNSFTGIPSALFDIPSLRMFWAPGALSGGGGGITLPEKKWASCRNLRVLNLAENGIAGTFPGSLPQCRRLVYLDLSGNNLRGHLPADFAFDCMILFNISRNSFTGQIPRRSASHCLGSGMFHQSLEDGSSVSSMEEAAVKSYLSALSAGRRMPEWVSDYGAAAVIHDVSENQFTGPLVSLPLAMESIPVYGFFASGNKLSGRLGEGLFDSCHRFQALILRLNRNRFTGPLPVEAMLHCQSLAEFDAAAANPFPALSTHAPRSRNKKHLIRSGSSMMGDSNPNPRMYAGGHNTRLHRRVMVDSSSSDFAPAPGQAGKSGEALTYAEDAAMGRGAKRRSTDTIKIALISAGCAIGVVLAILVMAFLCLRQDRRAYAQMRSTRRGKLYIFRTEAVMGMELTYEGIVRATGSFSLDNLIGSGGFGATYKAELKPGSFVAVKRLFLGKFHGTQQFEAEVRTLGSVRHPHLVTLLGYYSNKSDMFLLYNYLPGGNLDSLIHGEHRAFVGWKIRSKIAFDIANALVYLHDECVPRILHRDIKPSNVLLDNDLNAFLSDFGLARLLSASETHVTTDVLGTFGYVAPEYVLQNRVSDKADVYSYGVLLLELISGKKVMDQSFAAYGPGFDIVVWSRQLYNSGKPQMVFAAGLWEEEIKSQLMAVLKLALRCTTTSRSARPTMKQAVDSLRAAQEY